MATEELGNLVIKFAADTSDFSNKAKEIGKTLGDQAHAFNSIKDAAKSVFGSINDSVRGMATAFGVQKKVEADAFRTFGQGAQEIIALSGQLQGLTIFGDEVSIQAANVLGTMGQTQDQVLKLLPSLQDLAFVTGRDLPDAAKTLGDAIASKSLEPLKEMGVTFDEVTKKEFQTASQTQRVAMVLEQLQARFGGAAAEVKSAQKAIAQFDNATGDVYETLGKLLDAPGRVFYETLTSAVVEFDKVLQKIPDALRWIAKQFAELSKWLQTTSGQFVTAGIAFGGLAIAGGAVATALAGISWSGVIAGVGAVAQAVVAAGITMTKALLPVIATIGAVAAAAFGIILAIGTVQKYWDDIVAEMQFAITDLQNAIETATEKITNAFKSIRDKAKEWITPIAGWFKEMATAASELPGIKDVIQAAVEVDTKGTEKVDESVAYIKEKGVEVGKAIAEAGGAIKEKATAGLEQLKTEVASLGGEMKDLLKRGLGQLGIDDVTAGIGGLVDDLVAALGLAEEGVKKTATGIGEAKRSLLKEIWSYKPYDVAANQLSGILGTVGEYFRDFGERLGYTIPQIQDALNSLWSGVQTATSAIGEQALGLVKSQGGKVGGLVAAGAEGAAAGGPIGAIIAIIVDLISNFKSIMRTVDAMNAGFEMIADTLSPVFDGLADMSERVNISLAGLLDAIAPVVNAFKSIFDSLATATEFFTKNINQILQLVFSLLQPILSLISRIFNALDAVLKPVMNVFLSLFSVITEVFSGFTNLIDAINPVLKLFEGVAWLFGEIEKGLRGFVEGVGKAVDDVGKAFDDAIKFVSNGFKNLEEKAIVKATDAMLAYIEKTLIAVAAINDFKDSVKNSIENMIQAMALMNLQSGALQEALRGTIAAGLDAEGTAKVFQDVYDQFVAAGLSSDQALGKLSDSLVAGSKVHEEAFKILSDAIWGSDFNPAMTEAAENAEDLGEKMKEVTEALTNVPTGYKIVQRRLASIADEIVAATPSEAMTMPLDTGELPGFSAMNTNGSLGSTIAPAQTATVFNMENVTVVSNDPETLAEQLKQQRQWANMASTGLLIDTTPQGMLG